MDSPYWIKKQKTTINFTNKKDNKCFQYAVTVALNYKQIKRDPQRITKFNPITNRCNWEGINYPSEKDDWKKIEKSNLTIYILPTFQIIIQVVKNKLFF